MVDIGLYGYCSTQILVHFSTQLQWWRTINKVKQINILWNDYDLIDRVQINWIVWLFHVFRLVSREWLLRGCAFLFCSRFSLDADVGAFVLVSEKICETCNCCLICCYANKHFELFSQILRTYEYSCPCSDSDKVNSAC